jgi:hypothetical protein
LEVGIVDPLNLQPVGDLEDYDLQLTLKLIEDGDGNSCGDWQIAMESTGAACQSIWEPGREETYVENGGGYGVDEDTIASGLANKALDGDSAAATSPADWIPGTDKTLLDMEVACQGKGSHLLAKPAFDANAKHWSDTDSTIQGVCKDIAQDFYDVDLSTVTFGEDIFLQPKPLMLAVENPVLSNQAIYPVILDRETYAIDRYIYQDLISGDFQPGVPTFKGIPFAGNVPDQNLGSSQYATVSGRTTIQTNLADAGPASGTPMKMFTRGGVAGDPVEIDGYNSAIAWLDLHRVRKEQVRIGEPATQYMIFLDLMEPIDYATGSGSSFQCNIDQKYIIDGTCVCHETGSCTFDN